MQVECLLCTIGRRHQWVLFVKNVDAAIWKGTNNSGESRTSNVARGTVHGGFRRSIHVAQHNMTRPILNELLAESFTTDDYRLECWIIVNGNDCENGRCDVKNVDP